VSRVNRLYLAWVALSVAARGADRRPRCRRLGRRPVRVPGGAAWCASFSPTTPQTPSTRSPTCSGQPSLRGGRPQHQQRLARPARCWAKAGTTTPRLSRVGRLRLEWWQLDPGGLVVLALEKLGLVWDVRRPAAEKIAEKKRPPARPARAATRLRRRVSCPRNHWPARIPE